MHLQFDNVIVITQQKFRLTWFSCCVLFAFSVLCMLAGSSQAQQRLPRQISLPIEVMGTAGTTREVAFTLPSFAPEDSPQTLELRVHNLSYANKGSIQINQNAWVPLNNTTAQADTFASNYGGIGGPVATLTITLPLHQQLLPGRRNVLRFRFNGTDGLSTGYRILGFQLRQTGGQGLLPASIFTEEDTANWQPPLNTPADIADGERLWRTATLIESSLPNARTLRAHCTDCHAQDGRDLKYFNYSNFSIIERSKFHHLTEQQGKQIASFIRSRPTLTPGRPWNPPYQPGPRLDSRPVSDWSAGAGLEWVLTRDADSLSYIFPNGIDKDVIGPNGNLNAREIPIGFQLPDWNHWLPTIHPKDAFGDAFMRSDALKQYAGEGTGPSTWNLRTYLLNDATFARRRSGFSRHSAYGSPWFWSLYNFKISQLPPNINESTRELAEKIYSVQLWALVKNWELHHEFDMEELGQTVFGSQSEHRTWLSSPMWDASQRTAFRPMVPASLPTGISPRETSQVVRSRARAIHYLNNAWMYLTLAMNNGNRAGSSSLSWEYFLTEAMESGRAIEEPGVARRLMIFSRSMQSTLAPNDVLGNARRWSTFVVYPTVISLGDNSQWADVEPTARRQVFQTILDAWIDKNAQYSPAQYVGVDYYDPNAIAPLFSPPSLGSLIYQNLRAGKQAGLNTQRAVDWAKTMWHQAPEAWDALRQ